jgi:RsmE family RNA methyltransferase
MNIVIYKSDELDSDSRLSLNGRRADHILKILNAQPGDTIKLGEYGGQLRTGRVIECGDDIVQLKVEGGSLNQKPPYGLHLLLAMPRPQTLKKVLEITSCFSICSIELVQAEKVEKSYFSSKLLQEGELEKHVMLGLEQGRKVIPPRISINRNFFRTYEPPAGEEGSRFVLDSVGTSLLIDSDVSRELGRGKPCTVAIGPEGGWSTGELDWFAARDFSICGLGPTPLRVEYAVCSLLSMFEQVRYRNDLPAEVAHG